MPWVIAAALILFFMALTAKASTVGSGGSYRLQQLVAAISGIEGGSVSNPGNIRVSNAPDAQVGATGDLAGLITRAFITQTSTSYRGDMNFTEFAWMYVAGTKPEDWSHVASGDDPNVWADYVTGQLGVSKDSLVRDFLNS